MRMEGREGSSNVEDRRNMRPAAMVGGGGLMMIIIAVIFTLLRGGGVGDAVQVGVEQAQRQLATQVATGSETPVNPEQDEQAIFASQVLKLTEDVWGDLFPRLVGKPYQEPILVLFRDGVASACGRASSAMGPFYCPGDQKVYLDLTFFQEMRTKFSAPGDFASAYVIAHEVGHHVQNLLGLSMEIQRAQQQASSKAEANSLSVRLELQADFLAGVWAHHAQKEMAILEEGDIGEAIRAAQAIGDDTLQKQATGRVVPDAFTHGTSEQRIRWFTKGLQSGNLEELGQLLEIEYDQL